MSELLPIVAIVVVGLVGWLLRRHAPLIVRQLLIGGCTLVMAVFAVTDPEHRYVSLVIVLIGLAGLWRMRPAAANA